MNKKILLIDDDPQFRALASTVLKEKKLLVICAASAREASIELATTSFDLLIVDGNLPDSNGLSVIEDVRTKDSKSAILFVSASWRDSESYHRLTKDLFVNSILHKPILPAVLAQEVDKALGTWASAPIDKNAKMAEKLAKLSEEFGRQLPGDLDEIDKLILKSKLQNNLACIAESKNRIHMLRGTGASFGFPRITALMGMMEDRLSDLTADTSEAESRAVWEELELHLQEAQSIGRKLPAVRVNEKPSPSLPGHASSLSTLLLSRDDEIRALAQSYAKEKEIDLQTCSYDEARETVSARHFDMIFFDAQGNEERTFAFTRELRSKSEFMDVPIALIKKNNDKHSVIDEIYTGFDIVLTRPIIKEEIHSAFHNMVLMRNLHLARVLVIDDDQQFIGRVQALLGLEGMRVTSFCDTNRLFELIDGLAPELILLDIHMPGVSGFDICRKLRESKKWQRVPVIFISARTDWETRVAAFECGGDDYLAKPVINAELLIKSRMWLERVRRQDKEHIRDQLTRLLNHSSFLLQLKKVQGGLRDKKSVCVALLKVRNMAALNHKFGPQIGDDLMSEMADLMRQRFCIDAVRGRWGGSTLALGLEAREGDLRQVMDRFRSDFLKSSEIAQKCGSDIEIVIHDANELLGSW